MKIYPSPHLVRVAEIPEYLDIPVAHIEQEYHPEEIVAAINPEFALEDKKFVAPYQRFSTDNMLFFDNEENITEPNLRRDGYNYIYEPQNAQEFTPEEFKVWALIKRDDWLDSSKKYDLRVGIYKQPNTRDFAAKLITIFGDAPYRKISPANVTVNSGSTSIDGLMAAGGDGFDWLFIETSDGIHYKETGGNLDFDTLMRNNANLWLTVEGSKSETIFDKIAAGLEYKTSFLTFTSSGCAKGSGKVAIGSDYGYAAKKDTAVSGLPDYRFTYMVADKNERCPVYILEKPSSGYIVISHKNMFDHLDKYSSYIYNILLGIYCKSYVITEQKNVWITNAPVDYMGSLKSPFRRTHPKVNLDDMVLKTNNNIVSYSLKSVMFDVNDVIYVNKDNNGNMNFRKLTQTDPAISEKSVSVYTSKKTVAIYSDDAIRTIESGIGIFTEIDDEERCYITVSPFKSSKYCLVSSQEKRFEIKKVTEEYVLYALPIDNTNESTVGLMLAKEYDETASIELARITVKFVGDAMAYDVRLLGGGLPEKYTDYEMFDISNIKGRPYRVGTGAIVNLPEEYKEYDEIIKDAIDKHKVAGDKLYVRYGSLEETT